MAGEPPGTWHRFTGRVEGDLAPDSADVDRRRQRVIGGRWTWLRQVHGASVVVVDRPGQWAGEAADAAVTTTPGAVLSVSVADCAPVALLADGVVGVVHAGWRGLRSGIIAAAVAAVRQRGAGPIHAVIGPCIRPACYEFDEKELDQVVEALGPALRATTAQGRPALDLPGGVRAALREVGVETCQDLGPCTACSPRHWSHRAGADRQRQALVATVAP